jgi:DNA-directed RNA polymerase specialized sigma24 family protein
VTTRMKELPLSRDEILRAAARGRAVPKPPKQNKAWAHVNSDEVALGYYGEHIKLVYSLHKKARRAFPKWLRDDLLETHLAAYWRTCQSFNPALGWKFGTLLGTNMYRAGVRLREQSNWRPPGAPGRIIPLSALRMTPGGDPIGLEDHRLPRPDELAAQRDEAAFARAFVPPALEALAAESRRQHAVVLARLGGMTNREIARATKTSMANISAIYNTALRFLRAYAGLPTTPGKQRRSRRKLSADG